MERLEKDPEGYDRNMLELKTKASKLKARNLGFWTNYGKSTSKNCEKKDSSNNANPDPKPSTFFEGTETGRQNENEVIFGIYFGIIIIFIVIIIHNCEQLTIIHHTQLTIIKLNTFNVW